MSDQSHARCDTQEERKPHQVSQQFRRTIGPCQLSFLAFFAVCAGPYGIEDAVGSGGALPTLIAVLTLPLLWGLPQGLMTAELSTVLDENGGYIIWVNNILGPFWGSVLAPSPTAYIRCSRHMVTCVGV